MLVGTSRTSLLKNVVLRSREINRGPVFWMKKKSYRCPLCLGALSPPWRLNCNEVFCRNCVGNRLMEGHRDCPLCQTPIKIILIDQIIESIHCDPWKSDFINFYWQTIHQATKIRNGKIECIRHFEIDAWLEKEKHCLKPIKSWRNVLNRTKTGLALCLLSSLYARFVGGIRSATTWWLLFGGIGIVSYNCLRIHNLCGQLRSRFY